MKFIAGEIYAYCYNGDSNSYSMKLKIMNTIESEYLDGQIIFLSDEIKDNYKLGEIKSFQFSKRWVKQERDIWETLEEQLGGLSL